MLPTRLAAQENKKLQVFFVDVEGGQATLFVTPARQALLIAAAKKAGISKIDFVLITHFHNDHVGGLPQLAARVPIGTVIDHGENRKSTDAATVEVWRAYQHLLDSKKFDRLTVKPGDKLPVRGIDATVISSDGAVIANPLPGAGQVNPSCRNAATYPGDQTEDKRSLGAASK